MLPVVAAPDKTFLLRGRLQASGVVPGVVDPRRDGAGLRLLGGDWPQERRWCLSVLLVRVQPLVEISAVEARPASGRGSAVPGRSRPRSHKAPLPLELINRFGKKHSIGIMRAISAAWRHHENAIVLHMLARLLA